MRSKISHLHRDLVPNLYALTYVFSAYVLGLWACSASHWWINVVGVMFTAHALVIGAYLIHECIHNNVFILPRHNAVLGKTLLWLTGTGYSRYDDIRRKHFRHHVDHADVVAFDLRKNLIKHPTLLHFIQAMEWVYVPAIDVMMHSLVIILPFRLPGFRHRRASVMFFSLTRLAFFALLGYLSPRALALYIPAYLLFMHIMRFFDVHQHTFEVWPTLDRPRNAEDARFDSDYEQQHTFSNPLSIDHAWLNLFALNFPYHNAHHMKPTAAWYRLPLMHMELFCDPNYQVLPFRDLLRSYHRHRVSRIVNGDSTSTSTDNSRDFIGAIGVSFLIPF